MPRSPAPRRLALAACAWAAAVAAGAARAEAPRVPGARALAVPAAAEAPATPSAPAAKAPAPSIGGFPLEGARVPVEQIVAGGPKKGEIQAIDAPRFVSLEEATWVLAESPVLGVARGGEAHVYPVHVIERHQIVNDVLGGVPIAVTYDPLAGAPVAYERRLGESTLDFGVAGLLYNANFLLYDRATESLWSQLRGDALAGPLAGSRLVRLRLRQETLASWLERHPDSRVLAPASDTIDYRHSPFTTYWVENRIPSRVDVVDPRFHAKEVVLGVARDGKARAYLGSLVTAAGGSVDDEFAGRKLRIEYSSRHAVFRWDVPDDVEVQEAYWFAWKAFHPDTGVWRDPGDIGPLEE
jgi:hypothetical protein